jgi:predicted sulfurtransferase
VPSSFNPLSAAHEEDCSAARAIEDIESILATLDSTAAATNGWDEETRSAFRRVLVTWRDEILAAGVLNKTHFKVIGRWFLDSNVDASEVGEMAMRLDNWIYDCTHHGQPEQPLPVDR